jgi:hypothetical protein
MSKGSTLLSLLKEHPPVGRAAHDIPIQRMEKSAAGYARRIHKNAFGNRRISRSL